jgi:hypothetical protein
MCVRCCAARLTCTVQHAVRKLLRGPVRKVTARARTATLQLRAHLAAKDLRAREVVVVHAEPHLFEHVCNLLAAVHRAKRLHRDLLHCIGRFADFALLLVNVREALREPRAVDLDKELALSDCLQHADELDLLGLRVDG